ncbi:hypothetical protein [Echinimonas agarilytica]|uniref:DUF3829 domain-containing protein n=1 Tax=Echinimonas agarilytica TaxID=1215918 RepID=A0AA41W6E4_9GAMM|nr:hypothetical protein [Echinimonas agarilytica]MCM2679722.1 hypothetical protein [Echinimonas agarilytica]
MRWRFRVLLVGTLLFGLTGCFSNEQQVGTIGAKMTSGDVLAPSDAFVGFYDSNLYLVSAKFERYSEEIDRYIEPVMQGKRPTRLPAEMRQHPYAPALISAADKYYQSKTKFVAKHQYDITAFQHSIAKSLAQTKRELKAAQAQLKVHHEALIPELDAFEQISLAIFKTEEQINILQAESEQVESPQLKAEIDTLTAKLGSPFNLESSEFRLKQLRPSSFEEGSLYAKAYAAKVAIYDRARKVGITDLSDLEIRLNKSEQAAEHFQRQLEFGYLPEEEQIYFEQQQQKMIDELLLSADRARQRLLYVLMHNHLIKSVSVDKAGHFEIVEDARFLVAKASLQGHTQQQMWFVNMSHHKDSEALMLHQRNSLDGGYSTVLEKINKLAFLKAQDD